MSEGDLFPAFYAPRQDARITAMEVGSAFDDAADRQIPRWDASPGKLIWLDPLFYEPAEFGAVGDGVADDTAALQAALTAACDARIPLRLGHARYKITSGLSYTFTDSAAWVGGVQILGSGMGFSRSGSVFGSCIEPTNAVTGPAITIKGVANTNNSNNGQVNGAVFQDFGIRGVEGGTNGHGIQLEYYTNAVIRNVLISACATGIMLKRQANGATYGYANGTRFENVHVVLCREYAVDAADAGAILLDIQGCNFGTNTGGGVRMAPAPAKIGGNTIFTGNSGPAVRIVKPTGASTATGPTITGCHFEANGAAATATWSTDGAQIVIDSAIGPVITGCTFLGDGGQHSVKAGWGADVVNGLVMEGNRHFGLVSNANQRAFLLGSNCQRAVIRDKEIVGMGGSSSRATSAQAFGGASSSIGWAGIGASVPLQGAATCATGVAQFLFAHTDVPIGMRALFEISSQGGSVHAAGVVRRSRDGTTLSVVTLVASADCALSIVSNSLRVTQTNTASLQMFWSMAIQDTI